MLRQGVWCRSTWFTLGVGSDIRLRSSRSLWTDTPTTPAVQEPMPLSNERSTTRRGSGVRSLSQPAGRRVDDTPSETPLLGRQLRRGSRRPTP